MSNDETHDPQEPTGARLTDEQIGSLRRYAAEWSAFDAQHMKPTHILSNGVLDLLADRAALVAEVARLQDRLDAFVYLAGKQIERQEAAEAQIAAMCLLVEAVANDDASVYVNGKTYCGTCHVETWPDEKPHVPGCKVAQAIVMVATWQKGGVDSEA